MTDAQLPSLFAAFVASSAEPAPLKIARLTVRFVFGFLTALFGAGSVVQLLWGGARDISTTATVAALAVGMFLLCISSFRSIPARALHISAAAVFLLVVVNFFLPSTMRLPNLFLALLSLWFPMYVWRLAAPRMPSSESDSPVGPTLDRDIACIHCGYNLRSLASSGRCPECGNDVALSLRADRFIFLQPVWVKKFSGGLRLLVASSVLGILADCLVLSRIVLLPTWRAHLTLWSCYYAVILLEVAIIIPASWYLTAPAVAGARSPFPVLRTLSLFLPIGPVLFFVNSIAFLYHMKLIDTSTLRMINVCDVDVLVSTGVMGYLFLIAKARPNKYLTSRFLIAFVASIVFRIIWALLVTPESGRHPLAFNLFPSDILVACAIVLHGWVISLYLRFLSDLKTLQKNFVALPCH